MIVREVEMYVSAEYYAEEEKKVVDLQSKLNVIRQKQEKAAEEYGENWKQNPRLNRLIDDEKEIERQLEKQNEKFRMLEVKEVGRALPEKEEPEKKEASPQKRDLKQEESSTAKTKVPSVAIPKSVPQVHFEENIPGSIRPRLTLDEILAMRRNQSPRNLDAETQVKCQPLVVSKNEESSVTTWVDQVKTKVLNIIRKPFSRPRLVSKDQNRMRLSNRQCGYQYARV